MKNFLNIAVIATAVIGLSASAKSLEAVKAEKAVGKGGKTTETIMKEGVAAPKFMKALESGPKSNVENIVGTATKDARAREVLINGLEAKDPTAEAVFGLVAGLDSNKAKAVLKDLNEGVSLKAIAIANGILPSKSSVPAAGKVMTCSTSAQMEKFVDGFPSSLKSEFQAANDASKAVIPNGAWSNGLCAVEVGTDDGGSSEYDLSARQNLAKLIIGEKACNFTTSCATKVFAGMKKISEAAALPIIKKFNRGTETQKGCYIHRLADVDGNLATATR